MPCYCWVPSGGFRVVYEYANQLVARGHDVAVIHPRRLAFPPAEKFTVRKRIRRMRLAAVETYKHPEIYWHEMDSRVRLEYVPDSSAKYVPEADAIFATAWHTVDSVLRLAPSKGKKCYLIQGYETFLGPRELVEDTWRAPLHKVVIAQWLVELAESLDAGSVTHIPNALDPDVYRVIAPLERRAPRVAMMVSLVPFKASRLGIEALQIARSLHPALQATVFGTVRRPNYIPDWIQYRWNPSQDELVFGIYNGSSIVVSSSVSEGFALPPAEGAACGCAMVSTDSGGVRDFIEHGVTGLLSPPGDPEALAKNICTLLADDELRIRLARAGHECIQRFTWKRSADLMEAFLQRVVRGEAADAAEGCSEKADSLRENGAMAESSPGRKRAKNDNSDGSAPNSGEAADSTRTRPRDAEEFPKPGGGQQVRNDEPGAESRDSVVSETAEKSIGASHAS